MTEKDIIYPHITSISQDESNIQQSHPNLLTFRGRVHFHCKLHHQDTTYGDLHLNGVKLSTTSFGDITITTKTLSWVRRNDHGDHYLMSIPTRYINMHGVCS